MPHQSSHSTSNPDVLAAFSQSPAALALFDGPDFRLRFANEQYRRIIGRSPDLGESLWAFLPEVVGTEFEDLLREVLEQGKTIARDNVPLPMFEPRQVVCNFSCSPWRDEQGRVRGVMTLTVDTTEQFRAVAEAAAVDRRLRAMADALPHAIFVCGLDGRLRYVNQRWRAVTGMDELSCPSDAWAQVLHPEDLPLVASRWQACSEGRCKFDVYARLKGVGATEYRWQRLMARCYAEKGPHDMVWVGSWTDVHDRVVMTLANAAAQKQFVATLTHDLRSPLTGIRASVENMQRKTDPDAPFYVKFTRILKTVDRANAMLEQLLEVDRVTAAQASDYTFTPLNLGEQLSVSIAGHQAVHGDRFVAQVPNRIEGHWHAPTLMRAIDNLLGNAFKYGDDGRPVTLAVQQSEEECCIRVHNWGNPLTEQEQRRVFVPYARGSHQDTKGWGLGLSMVVGAAKVHKGRVQVDSDAERGTTFTLRLPNRPADAPAVPGGSDAEQGDGAPWGPHHGNL